MRVKRRRKRRRVTAKQFGEGATTKVLSEETDEADPAAFDEADGEPPNEEDLPSCSSWNNDVDNGQSSSNSNDGPTTTAVELDTEEDGKATPFSYQCTLCGHFNKGKKNCFGSVDALREHLSVEHLHYMPYQCFYCPVSSASERCIRLHHQRLHGQYQIFIKMHSPDKILELELELLMISCKQIRNRGAKNKCPVISSESAPLRSAPTSEIDNEPISKCSRRKKVGRLKMRDSREPSAESSGSSERSLAWNDQPDFTTKIKPDRIVVVEDRDDGPVTASAAEELMPASTSGEGEEQQAAAISPIGVIFACTDKRSSASPVSEPPEEETRGCFVKLRKLDEFALGVIALFGYIPTDMATSFEPFACCRLCLAWCDRPDDLFIKQRDAFLIEHVHSHHYDLLTDGLELSQLLERCFPILYKKSSSPKSDESSKSCRSRNSAIMPDVDRLRTESERANNLYTTLVKNQNLQIVQQQQQQQHSLCRSNNDDQQEEHLQCIRQPTVRKGAGLLDANHNLTDKTSAIAELDLVKRVSEIMEQPIEPQSDVLAGSGGLFENGFDLPSDSSPASRACSLSSDGSLPVAVVPVDVRPCGAFDQHSCTTDCDDDHQYHKQGSASPCAATTSTTLTSSVSCAKSSCLEQLQLPDDDRSLTVHQRPSEHNYSRPLPVNVTMRR